MTTFLQCGHIAQTTDPDHGDVPCCVMCKPSEATRTPAVEPNLEGRKAKCRECDKTRDSSLELAFFRHQPLRSMDSFFCGCGGWD